APQRLAAAAERRRRAARDVAETVVARRTGILVPPVAADEPVVAQPHTGVGIDPVDDRADPERARRRRAVSFAVTRRESVAPDPPAPRPEHAPPAFAHGQRRGRR